MRRDVVVSCSEVNKNFVSKNGELHRVLQGINFVLHRGELVVLIGPSGCGKSTLLNMIAGFDKPSSGEILIEGKVVRGPGPDKAMVFQDYALLPWLNARENVEIGLKLKGIPKAKRRNIALEFLNLVGLNQAAERPAYKLSGGMQQRVSIARALALSPTVLLMDEPFGALDAFQRGIMHRELLRIWKATNATIIFVTHSLEEALFLGTRVVAMTPDTVGMQGEIKIELARPRDPLSAEFAAIKRRLFEMLTAHFDAQAVAFAE
jgi:ABC-type nitrate/sulfonate/bicarbonate transport system ATPase subunit